MLRDRIVLGIRNNDTQTELLEVRNLTLAKCVDICKASENVQTQNRGLHPEVTVDKVRLQRPRYRRGKQEKEYLKPRKLCKFCGGKHKLRKEECPAFTQTCRKCGERNHFACCCASLKQKKFVHQVADDSSSGGEWVNVVKIPQSKEVRCRLLVGGKDVVFQVDTGSSVNLIRARYADGTLKPTNRVLRMWNHTQLSPLGVCRKNVRNPKNGRKYSVEFVVCKENFVPLLGLQASQQMELIDVCDDNFDRVRTVNVEDKYSYVFSGKLGMFPGLQHLKVIKDVKPMVMPDRRIPLAVRPKLKAKLDRLTSLDVITPVDEPTPWVRQMVVVEKKGGDLRICNDPRELNKALLREHYTFPVLEDTLHELGQSRVFSKADLSSGYWHVQLDETSSLLTTFQTCFGRFRWLRLPFGFSVSSEIFQTRLLEAVNDLPGVICIADDVIIHGKTLEEHDHHLDQFMKRCQEKNIQLNKNKFTLRSESITFMGNLIT